MIAELHQIAQGLHGVADAAERLKAQTTVSLALTILGPSDRDRAEAIDRGQWNESMKKILAAVDRHLAKR